jgi:excisionase family DNA binding protein
MLAKSRKKNDLATTSGASPPLTMISIATVAERMGVDAQTVARWIKTGKLRAYKINRRVLIRESDIEAMLAANPA